MCTDTKFFKDFKIELIVTLTLCILFSFQFAAAKPRIGNIETFAFVPSFDKYLCESSSAKTCEDQVKRKFFELKEIKFSSSGSVSDEQNYMLNVDCELSDLECHPKAEHHKIKDQNIKFVCTYTSPNCTTISNWKNDQPACDSNEVLVYVKKEVFVFNDGASRIPASFSSPEKVEMAPVFCYQK